MTELWAHQQGGIDYLDKNKNWGLLMMGVATGKTRTTLEFIQRRRFKFVLIVGTQKGVRVWNDEFHKVKFDTYMFIYEFNEGALKERIQKMHYQYQMREANSGRPLIFCVNYEAFARDNFFNELMKFPFDCIIFDEVHRLRGHSTNQSKNAYKLAIAQRNAVRVGLTGTIIYTRPLDVFGIFRFINPKVFGTNWTKFRYRYAVWGGQFGQYPLYYINLEELQAKVTAHSYIVRREDVLTLPEEQHIIRKIKFTEQEQKKYDEFNREYIVALSDKEKLTATNVLDKVGKLQQLTSGFVYLNEAVDFSRAKIEELATLLDEIGDNPSVVFYKYKAEKDRIASLCKDMDREAYYIDGAENTYEGWLKSSAGILIVQIQSGSESIDLTKSGIVIFYSLMYAYGQYEQARGRISRPNSEHSSIVYYYLLVNNSIDQKIYKALQDKKDLIEEILNGS